MPLMRAKMKVECVTQWPKKGIDNAPAEYEEISLRAVSRNDGYPKDGSDENNTFSKFTPTADLQMTITNKDLFGKIKLGDEFYVDFTKVSE